jgi:hypothetical protein
MIPNEHYAEVVAKVLKAMQLRDFVCPLDVAKVVAVDVLAELEIGKIYIMLQTLGDRHVFSAY